MAPLLLSYGKALYELAYETQGPMGRGEVDKQAGGAADGEFECQLVALMFFTLTGHRSGG